MKRTFTLGAVCALVLGGVAPAYPVQPAEVVSQAAVVTAPYDFDGDGFGDMVSGVPREDIGWRQDAGAVQVLYGSAAGPTARDQMWHQDRPGIKGGPEPGDSFGSATASGDFDGDGYADLAVGIPGEDLGGYVDTGAVQVLYGAVGGLTARDQLWHQGRSGVPGSNEAGDRFGDALAVGDFNADGRSDVAINVAGERFTGSEIRSRVVVLFGSGTGLTATGVQSWNVASPGLPTVSVAGPLSGPAAGDVNGDGHDDLVLPDQHYGDTEEGSLVVLPGAAIGLTAVGAQVITGKSMGLVEPLGGHGLSAAAADFNADGRDDLAGLSWADDRGISVAYVLYATGSGFDPSATQLWTLRSGAPVVVATGDPVDCTDGCGPSTLDVGDLTGDRAAELVLGNQNPGAASGGEVNVLTGSQTGLVPTGSLLIQGRDGIPDVDEPGDGFGAALHVVTSRGPAAWLVIGAPGEDLEPIVDVGAVTVVPGSASGLVPAAAVQWHQNSPGIKGGAEAGDSFGSV